MSTLHQASQNWANRPQDQRFVTLHDLHEYKQNVRRQSRENVVSNRAIMARPTDDTPGAGMAIVGPSGNPFAPTHWAFGQIAQRAGAPASYLRTLPAAVAADCINYGLKFNRQVEEIGLLTYQNGSAQITAATGPNYGRIWDEQIAAQLVKRFGNGIDDTDWRVPGIFGKQVAVTKENTTLYASDRDMFVFLADEKNRIEMPNRRNGEAGSLARGFFLWNSEVGSTSIGAAFFLFDYVCSNRIVWGVNQFKEIRLRHTKGAPERWLEEIQPVLIEYSQAATMPIVETIKAAQAHRIDNAKADFLATRFTAKLAASASAAHAREEGRPIETLWDAVTGLTAHAKTLPYQDERVAIEREAGKLLALAA